MSVKNYYLTLGIPPHATQKEITEAYITLAKKWHPDKNKGMDTTSQIQIISEAYGILKNTDKRQKYNIEYYKQYINKPPNQTTAKVKVEKCFFCEQNISNPIFAHKVTYYKETNRTRFPQSKVWYQTIEIKIPRCENCKKNHGSGLKLFMLLPIISFSLLGFILGITIWGVWLLWLIIGGLLGLLIGNILCSINSSIIAKEAGTKEESMYFEYEPIVILEKEGWSTSQPQA